MCSGTALESLIKRGDRQEVDLAALAFRADGSSLGVRLRNMSYNGCLLESESAFAIGEKIRIVLPRMGEIKVQIRWTSAEGKSGVRFVAEEIAPQDPHSKFGL